ncbi:MobF family relaxase [Serratia sp. PF-27]|uniref:MobF family relaxase n=3 Tax=unclassified Serratia (in: enterobacteria) TaxID=2647522 RepID=UPI0024B605AF|nr:MobF family relaxase [Serratia sp. PF-27]MDI9224357.1 MobF family relaxase [Serratia bockelmannii]MDI9266446.1 MobF family relaxase [Serratia sp. PF-27]
MLSVSAVKSAANAAGYYEQKDNYYFIGEMATEWLGTGAESLGLEGPVKGEVFRAVLEGHLPDGGDLSHMKNGKNTHQPGIDLTFSAPKSVSVLALVAGDTFLIGAHKRAVAATLNELEKFASTRTMTDGVSALEQTGNLVVATFLHDTSRNLDPQLHTHAIVANATLAAGGWKTLSSDTQAGSGFNNILWKEQVSIGAMYRGFLRADLEKAGYVLRDAGPHGMYEIDGVPTEPFSSRRQDILAAAGTDAGSREKTRAALDTRKTKDFTSMDAVRDYWRQKLKDELGFDYAAFKAGVDARAEGKEVEPAPQTAAAALLAARTQRQAAQDDAMTPAQAVEQAIAVVSKSAVRFGIDAVLTAALGRLPMREGVYGAVRAEIETAVARGALLAVDGAQTLFTSAAHVRDEQRLSQLAARLAARRADTPAPAQATGIVAQWAQAGRGLTLIDARGGQAFQADLLARFGEAAAQAGRESVVVVASRAARSRLKGADVGTVMTVEEVAERGLPASSQVLLPESEQLSVPQLHQVLQAVDRSQGVAVVLDTHARRATGFGAEVLRAAGVTQLKTSERQENATVTLVQKDTVDDRLQVAARHVAKQAAAGLAVVAQTGNARTRAQLTQTIRTALGEEGVLGATLRTVDTLSPVWLDAGSRQNRGTYKVGMVLERVEGKQVLERMTVVGVSKETHKLSVEDANGNRSGLSISAIDSRYRLWQKASLTLQEGERVRATGELGHTLRAGAELRVVGLKPKSLLFRERLVVEDAQGKRAHIPLTGAPLKMDYAYTESLGASRKTQGQVVAVLAGKEVSDATVNQLRRSGDAILAFTPLSEADITARLTHTRTSVTITQGLQALSGKDDVTDALRSLQQARLTPTTRAVGLAIEKATGTNVMFSALKVAALAGQMDERVTPDVALGELARLERRGDIIALATVQGRGDTYIRRESWEQEKTVLRHIAEGKNSLPPLTTNSGLTKPEGDPSQTGRAADPYPNLTQGQRQAAEMILTSKDRFVTIQGYAGVGKTTQFKVVAAALASLENPPKVVGLAPTHRAVSELTAAGIPAQTLASFLSEQARAQEGGEKPDFSRTVFVLDESSMVGNRDMATAVSLIAEGGGRAVKSGDEAQHKPLESGVPFSLTLHRSAADVAIMQDIVRQTPALRPAIEAMIAGNVREAVNVAQQVGPDIIPREAGALAPPRSVVDLKTHGESDVAALIAADYVGRTPEARDNTLIIAELNADRRAINDAVHDRLQAEGKLGESITVSTLNRVSNSQADLGSRAFWQANTGNIVKMNDDYFTIRAVDGQSGTVSLTGLDGQDERWLAPATLRRSQFSVFEAKTMTVSVGERLRLTTTDRDRLLRTNDIGVVTGIDDRGRLQVTVGEQQVSLDPNAAMGDRHIDYGYAVTTYSAQGASVDYVILLEGVEGARKRMAAQDSAYVALSRTKEHIQMYVDDLEGWQRQVEKHTGKRETVHDVLLRADDAAAQAAVRAFEAGRPAGETRLAGRLDADMRDAAHFQGGGRPALLYAVVNEHGRHRGNWVVPVSPATGRLDIDNAHYQGAEDGERVVLRQGEKETTPLTATTLDEARALMQAQPDRAVLLLRGDAAAATDETASAQSDTPAADTLRLEEELKAAREREAIAEVFGERKATDLPDEKALEADAKPQDEAVLLDLSGRDIDAIQEADRLRDAVRGLEATDDKRPAMANDEVNIVRHAPETDPDMPKTKQKTME